MTPVRDRRRGVDRDAQDRARDVELLDGSGREVPSGERSTRWLSTGRSKISARFIADRPTARIVPPSSRNFLSCGRRLRRRVGAELTLILAPGYSARGAAATTAAAATAAAAASATSPPAPARRPTEG